MRAVPAVLLTLVIAACGSVESSPEPTPGSPSSGSPSPSQSPAPSSSDPGTPGQPSQPGQPTDPGQPSQPAQPAKPPLTAAECFKDLTGPVVGPNYDQFKPTIAPSCAGTHHQTITGVERLVYLGDSITVGTPPTLPKDFYSARLEKKLETKFGSITTSSCAAWGAQTNDLLDNDKQIEKCFPVAMQSKRTLVVMTMGGNDIHGWAKDKPTLAQAKIEAQQTADNMRAAIGWLQTPGRFPNGVFVVFANVYEYTDTSGDLSSCPTASLAGMSGTWAEGAPAVVMLQEQLMKVAVDTKTDLMFMLEHFCGHGWNNDDPTLQCYRGPNTPRWIDATCIHPNPDGHEQIANQFMKVIEGT